MAETISALQTPEEITLGADGIATEIICPVDTRLIRIQSAAGATTGDVDYSHQGTDGGAIGTAVFRVPQGNTLVVEPQGVVFGGTGRGQSEDTPRLFVASAGTANTVIVVECIV